MEVIDHAPYSSHAEAVREVRRLSILRDPSIAKVVAVATNLSYNGEDSSSAAVGLMTEYLEGGPLPIYLRQYRFGAADNFEPGVKTIRYMIHVECRAQNMHPSFFSSSSFIVIVLEV